MMRESAVGPGTSGTRGKGAKPASHRLKRIAVRHPELVLASLIVILNLFQDTKARRALSRNEFGMTRGEVETNSG
jgi:hypothetical protein